MNKTKTMFVMSLTLALLCVGAHATEKKSVMLPGANPDLPFSNAVWTGDFLYTAGSLGSVPGEGYPDGIEAQTRQTFKNLERILAVAELDLSRVVMVNVFLTDARYYQGMNKVFKEVFPSNAPARATVQTDLAAPAGVIEISLVAAKRGIEIKRIRPDGWQESGPGYAYGMLAGDTLFVAGLVSNDPAKGGIVAGGIDVQTNQALDNLNKVLAAAGMQISNVVSNRVYLSDGRDFAGMNEAYKSVFSSAPPARATVRAGIMSPALRVEIQSVAVMDSNRKVGGTARAGSPLSPSIVSGKRQFLSGMTGRGPDGYAPGDVKAQTRQAIMRLKATLEANGLTLADVVDSTVFLTDIRHFSAMNEVYRELIPSPRPSRTTVGAPLMSPDGLVEIQFIADSGS